MSRHNWTSAVKERPAHEVARALGMTVDDPQHFGPCPACQEERAGREDRRGPLGQIRAGGWVCTRCGAKGSVLDLAALLILGQRPQSREDWTRLREALATCGLAEEAPASQARPPLTRPPRDELRTLWESAAPVGRDLETAEYLRGRGIDPDQVPTALVRALQGAFKRPVWWPYPQHLFRLAVLACDLQGRAVSMQARAVRGIEGASKRWPKGCSSTDLVFACPTARRLLTEAKEGDRVERVIVVEGMTDWMSARAWLDPGWAVIGAASGGFRALGGRLAELRPALVVIATDPDDTGARYARDVAAPLGGTSTRVERLELVQDVNATGREALRSMVAKVYGSEPPRVIDGIDISADLPTIIEDAVESLVQLGGLYTRGGALVELRTEARRRTLGADLADDFHLARLGRHRLRHRMAEATTWFRWRLDTQADEWVRDDVHPPLWAADAVLELGQWPVPGVTVLSNVPVLRPDGRLHVTPGVDDATGALLIDGPALRACEVPERPTRADALAALATLYELVSDFPFTADADRAAWVALVLTAVGRSGIDGPTPIFGISATVKGSGKSLLSDVVGLIATGRPPPHQTWTPVEEEARKSITSILLAGTPYVMWDNVACRLGGASLDALLTSRTWTDRRLGESEMVRPLDVAATFCATGNNLEYRGDLARRLVPIELSPGVECPEDRANFKIPELLPHVAHRRAELVGAALTILVAWLRSGEVPACHLGGFEGWARTVPSALVWLDQPDPLDGMRARRQTADASSAAAVALLDAWDEVYGDVEVLARQLVADCRGRQDDRAPADLAAALDELLHGRPLQPAAVGTVLGRLVGRSLEGRVLTRRLLKGRTLWRVEVAP